MVSMTGLLQVSQRGQVDLAGGDEGGAAPVGANPTRIDRGDVAQRRRGVVAGKGIAVALAEVGIVVAEIKREHALGDADTEVPSGVARVGNAVRERRRAGRSGDLRAVETVGCPGDPGPASPDRYSPKPYANALLGRGVFGMEGRVVPLAPELRTDGE